MSEKGKLPVSVRSAMRDLLLALRKFRAKGARVTEKNRLLRAHRVFEQVAESVADQIGMPPKHFRA